MTSREEKSLEGETLPEALKPIRKATGISVRLKALNGSVITVTLAAGQQPVDERDALALAHETIVELAASLHPGLKAPVPQRPGTDDGVFSAWAYR